MKRFHCVRFLLAMASAALLSACGGGDVNGDLFVSVEQFESGGAGFFLQGTGGNLRIKSDGVGVNSDIVDVKTVGTKMQGPFKATTDLEDSSSMAVPDGWEDLGKVANQSRFVSGVLKADGQILTTISSMIYSIEEGQSRGHLSMTFSLSTSSNNALFSEALAGFFGCTSTVVRNTTGSNSNYYGNYWQYTNNNRRVVFPDATGVGLQIWFDFTTGTAVVQLVGAVANDQADYYDTDNRYYNSARTYTGPTVEGAIFTASNTIFRKTIN